MAQISNVSEVNVENIEEKPVHKVKRIKVKKYKKKRSGVKRKNNLFFKRKRLLRSLILRKQLLKMSDGQESSSLVHKSDKRWQQEDEVAFWKARAISLEYENKMLHKHIKQMYISMISQNNQSAIDYDNYNDEDTVEQYPDHDYLEESGEQYQEFCYEEETCEEYIDDEEFNKESKEFRKKRDKERARMKKEVDSEDEEESKPPKEQLSKIREEEMRKLYGAAWRKIMGMETAVQLNYELTIEKNNIKYWPCLPIRL